jgi:hypothetical protein
MGETLDRDDVEAVHFILILYVARKEFALKAKSSIVYEKLQPRLRGDAGFNGVQIGIKRQIGRENFRILQLGRQLLQPFLAAGDKEEAIALLRQPAGKNLAYAAGSAGNQGYRSGFNHGYARIDVSDG